MLELIDEVFLSYNAGRLREACRLFVDKMLADDATVGLSLSGALTPAGLGISCLVPLIEAGFIDWIVSTGANLYHDTHFALGMDMHQSRPGLDDLELRENQVIRIYDIVFDYENLLGTDRFYRTLCRGEAFQKTMGTAEFHYLVGKYLAAREDETAAASTAACWRPPIARRADLHVVAGRQLDRHEPGRPAAGRLQLAHRSAARRQPERGHRLGRQEGRPQRRLHPRRRLAQELHPADRAADPGSARPGGERPRLLPASHRRPPRHRRPDGATPQEAMTWGKVDPEQLPDTVTCYLDSTVALPLLTAYALATHRPRKPRRLMDRLEALTGKLGKEYAKRHREKEG